MRLLDPEICKHFSKIFSPYLTAADDGYSGTNFERPDWLRLIAEAEDGKISTVIVKDISRLGRDYLKVGYYSEAAERLKLYGTV